MLSSGLRQVRKQSKYMRQRIKVQKQAITDLETDSQALALASDTSTLDGYAGTTVILDEWHEAKEVVGGGKDMPILHMSQLVGLALGISPAEMGMPKRHLTDTAAVTKFVG